MYYIFFICSSVDGHLGCFHVLAIENSVGMDIRVYLFFLYPSIRFLVTFSFVIKNNARIAKTWKQPKCPSTEEWIKKMWYIYTQWNRTQALRGTQYRHF